MFCPSVQSFRLVLYMFRPNVLNLPLSTLVLYYVPSQCPNCLRYSNFCMFLASEQRERLVGNKFKPFKWDLKINICGQIYHVKYIYMAQLVWYQPYHRYFYFNNGQFGLYYEMSMLPVPWRGLYNEMIMSRGMRFIQWDEVRVHILWHAVCTMRCPCPCPVARGLYNEMSVSMSRSPSPSAQCPSSRTFQKFHSSLEAWRTILETQWGCPARATWWPWTCFCRHLTVRSTRFVPSMFGIGNNIRMKKSNFVSNCTRFSRVLIFQNIIHLYIKGETHFPNFLHYH